MVTLVVSTEVGEDRKVTLTLPPEIPVGKVDLLVSVRGQSGETSRRPRTSLADWADAHAESWGGRLSSTDVEAFTGRRY